MAVSLLKHTVSVSYFTAFRLQKRFQLDWETLARSPSTHCTNCTDTDISIYPCSLPWITVTWLASTRNFRAQQQQPQPKLSSIPQLPIAHCRCWWLKIAPRFQWLSTSLFLFTCTNAFTHTEPMNCWSGRCWSIGYRVPPVVYRGGLPAGYAALCMCTVSLSTH